MQYWGTIMKHLYLHPDVWSIIKSLTAHVGELHLLQGSMMRRGELHEGKDKKTINILFFKLQWSWCLCAKHMEKLRQRVRQGDNLPFHYINISLLAIFNCPFTYLIRALGLIATQESLSSHSQEWIRKFSWNFPVGRDVTRALNCCPAVIITFILVMAC